MTPSQQQKGDAFRALHEGEPFVIPNPWDAGSARVLAGLGFKALATTSGGFAFTLGRLDSGIKAIASPPGGSSPAAVALEEVAAHVTAVDQATDLPVSTDLEDGYGPKPEDAARAITAAGEAGAVGGSIEDWDGAEERLYETEEATERIAAAVEAASAFDFTFTLTARAENFVRGNPDLDDTVARLQAYEQAGADVLYAPFLREVEQMKAVCDAVSKPVNVLAFGPLGLSMSEIAGAGAQRVSVGAGLTWTAMTAVVEAAEKMRDEGDFSGLGVPGPIKDWLADG